MKDLLLMTPGPTYVSEEVRRAMARPIINPDIDPKFYEFYLGITKKLKTLLYTGNDTLVLSGEGILGLEAACASIIEPGDRVLCIDNGIFGRGFGDFAKMYGGEVTFFKGDYRAPVDVQELERFLEKDNDFKMATVVHCETPSGLINPVDKICPLLSRYGILTVVDAVSSIGGEELRVDDWKIDIALGGSQKCLSAPPGLTFMSISQNVWDAVSKRKASVAGFYCNLALWKTWYQDKWFPYTMPVSDLYGFDVALDRMIGDEERYKRHSRVGTAVRDTLTGGGFGLYPIRGHSNTVTAFIVPEGLDERAFREHLVKKYDVMIAGAFDVLAGEVLRIGHMGENCHEEKLYMLFKALDSAFREFGVITEVSLHQMFAETV